MISKFRILNYWKSEKIVEKWLLNGTLPKLTFELNKVSTCVFCIGFCILLNMNFPKNHHVTLSPHAHFFHTHTSTPHPLPACALCCGLLSLFFLMFPVAFLIFSTYCFLYVHMFSIHSFLVSHQNFIKVLK